MLTPSELLTWINNKLSAGEIHLGAPTLKPGQTLKINRQEGRYSIEE